MIIYTCEYIHLLYKVFHVYINCLYIYQRTVWFFGNNADFIFFFFIKTSVDFDLKVSHK